jgi:hypothetical protein
MPNETFLALTQREFRRHRRLAEQAAAQVTDEQFFRTLGSDENSIAIIVKHLSGNMRSRWRDFLTADGEKPERNRDAEFEVKDEESRSKIMSDWNDSWNITFNALAPLTDADLSRTVWIRGEEFTVLQAISRQLTHYAYHVGQIVLLARHFAGGAWTSLSIPKNRSNEFNQHPADYLNR